MKYWMTAAVKKWAPLLAVALMAPWAVTANAQTWYGTVSSDWNNPTNWTPVYQIPGNIQSVPASGSSITIQSGAPFYPVVTTSLNLGSITMYAGSFTMTSGSLTVGSLSVGSGATFTVGAGVTVTTSGGITLNSSSVFTINQGAMVNCSAGGINLNTGGGTVNIYGTLNDGANSLVNSANVTLSGATLTAGSITLNGGSMTASGGSITGGGALTVAGGSLALSSTTLGVGAITVNGSSMTVTGGSITGNGALTVAGGSLALSGGTTLAVGAVTVSGNTFTMANATMTSGAISVQNGSFTLNAGATVTSSGGGASTMSGGSFTVNSGATATFSGGLTSYNGSFTTLPGSTLNIAGPIGQNSSWSVSGGNFTLGGGTETLPAGTFSTLSLTGGGTYTLPSGGSVTGNLTIAAGTVASLASGVNVTAGTLTLGTAGEANGTWGSSASTAANQNNTYFAGPGIVTVSTNTATKATTTTLAALSASTYGNSVTFTATVSLAPTGGTVQFATNGVALGAAASVTSGKATFTTSALPAGSYSVTAIYSGNSTYTGSTSAAGTQTVNKAAVTVSSGVTVASRTYDGTTTATLSTGSVVLNGVLAADAASVTLSTSGYTATFASPAAASGVSVTVSGLTLTGSAAGNYTLTQPTGLTATITAAPVTITSGITANGKDYNGTTAGTIVSNNVVLSGVLAADTANVALSTNGYTATFASANAASGIAVTIGGLTLKGSASANYALVQPAGQTATINAARVTVASGLMAANKAYDGTTTATISSNNVVLSGVVAGDIANVKLSTNGYTATFASAAAGNAVAVTVSGLALTGNAAGNYKLTQPVLSANITAVTVTIASGITANSKAYDGTTAATLGFNNVVLTGIAPADAAGVQLSTSGYNATFASAAAGSGIRVTVSGLTLTGSAAGNYTLTQPSGLTASIATLPVTVASGLTANSKVYSGTTAATITANGVVLSGVLAGDTANVHLSTTGYSATFASAAVANGTAVTVSGLTLTGTAAANYTLTQPALAANITPAPVTVASGVTVVSKSYDGTTTATITANGAVLSGVLPVDAGNVLLSTSGYTANFASAAVGHNIAVTVSGLTLAGSAAGNYTLTQPTGLTAGITAAPVTVASGVTANNKGYDGNTKATITVNNVQLTGIVAADAAKVTLSTNGYTATFANPAVASGVAVTVSGLTLTGSAAANYALIQPAGLTANITSMTVTITSGVTAASKVYDGGTAATITANSVVLSGVASGDTANVKLSVSGYSAVFASPTVGNGIGVTVSGLTLTGSAAANYTLVQPSLTANITAAPVTIASGITADNKAYDGTKQATISSNNVVLTGVLAADTAGVALSTNGYTATFASAAAANTIAVTVSGLTLTGSAAGNYTLAQPTGLAANITQMAVTITSPTSGQQIVDNGGTVSVSGKTTGNAVVSQVLLSLDGVNWTPGTTADNWTNWTAVLPVPAGTSALQAYAVDVDGNVSATATVAFTVIHTSLLTVLTSGDGTVSPNYNGQSLKIGQSYTMAAAGQDGWTFKNWTSSLQTSNSTPSLTFTMSSNLVLTANFANTTKPTLAITTPKSGAQIISNLDTIAVAGTAAGNVAGNVGVASVWLSLDGVNYTNATSANNFTNWSAVLPVGAGAQMLSAYAVDATGNYSATNTVAFTIIHTGLLAVTTNGNGTVSPNYNGQTLEIGQPYAMTANPAAGWKLSSWTSNLLPATNAANLKFTMASNLVLTASFAYTIPPTLSVIALTNRQVIVTNSTTTTVKGTAASKVPLAGVLLSINGSSWTTAVSTNGWTNWTGVLPIAAGAQVLQAYAVDIYGNNSLTNTINFDIAHTGYMTVRTNGNGTVSPDYDNTYLQIGGVYTMQATGRHGWTFTNWTSNFSPGIITNNAYLTFQMVSNLIITANYVDVSMPSLGMTVIPKGLRSETNLSPLVVNGVVTNAADDSLVTNVLVSFNHGPWQSASSANNFTNWTFAVVPQPGSNTISAYALDIVGNHSYTNTFMFSYNEALPLTVQTDQFGTGQGTISLSTNGQNLIVGTKYFIKAQPAAGCVFSNWTSNLLPASTSGTLEFTMVSNLVLYANFLDVTKPTLTVTNLAAGQVVTTTPFPVRGAAADNVAVGQVMYSVNSNAWQTATGTTSWAAGAPLNPGTNNLRVYCLDTAGNSSPTNSINVDYAVPAALTLYTNGLGSITGQAANYFIGQTYTLTAVPAKGFSFSAWTGNLVPGTNNSVIKFKMAPNLVLTANFANNQTPVLTMTVPAPTRLTNNQYTATGTASDSAGLGGVYLQLNGGAWTLASTSNGFTNWSLAFTLTGGTNLIRAYAVDNGGLYAGGAARYSPTSSITVFFLSAPYNLDNLRATVTPDDGTPAFEMDFGATTFSQYAWGTNGYDGAGAYTYANPNLSSGVLNLQSFALPGNSYSQSLKLDFTDRYIAQFTYTNGDGRIVGATAAFTTISNLAPPTLSGQTLTGVDASGVVGTFNLSTNGQLIQTNNFVRETNGWTYQTYGPTAGLLVITNATGTNWTLIHYEVVHAGEYATEGSDGSFDTGVVGFVRPSATGDAPAVGSLAGHVLLVNSGETLTSITLTGSQFALTTSDNSFSGSGSYAYSLVNNNAGRFIFNYSPPAGGSVTNVVQFDNPTFGIFTNSTGVSGLILR